MSPQDYANGVTKDTLRRLLDETPVIPQTAHLRQAIAELLSAKTIQPIPYTYTIPYYTAGAANNIALAAVNVQGAINIQSDADFLVLNHTYDANTLNAARTRGTRVVPNATVLLTDTGSGYNLMDTPVPIQNIFGDGEFPYVLPEPKLFPAKATIQSQVSNTDAAVGYNIWLSFNGVKLFAYN